MSDFSDATKGALGEDSQRSLCGNAQHGNLAGKVLLSLLVAVMLVSAFVSLPSTVMYPRRLGSADPIRGFLIPILPEEWPFFTKAPDSSELTAFKATGNQKQKVTPLSVFPNSRPSNFFGLSRTQRAQGPELANLANQLNSPAWVECEKMAGDCFDATLGKQAIPLTNDSVVPTVCGDVLLAVTVPVPWVYRKSYSGWRVNQEMAHLNVTCTSRK